MNIQQLELSRVLELACRRINPPHDPRVDAISIAELGGDELGLDLSAPQWRSAYLRGLRAAGVGEDGTGTLHLWPVEGGHMAPILSLAVLADGRLASGSEDKTIRIWSRDAKGTWTSEATLEGHSGSVSALAGLADGRLASGSGDNTIRIWSRDAKGRWTSDGPIRRLGGPVCAMASLDSGFVAAGSAVNVFEASSNGGWRRIRLLATPTAVVHNEFDLDGTVTLVQITPVDPTGTWQTIPNSDDPAKPLPCDSNLHLHAALIGRDGGLVEVWERPDQYQWQGREGDVARTLILRYPSV